MAFLALYLALIMLFKEDIVNHLYLVAIMKGLAEGFYYYPRNILNSSIITNSERKKYNGFISAINQASGIIIPILLGILLSNYSYVDVGKGVFVFVIIIYILSFFVKDTDKMENNIGILQFYKKIKKNNLVQSALIMQFLQGFTIGSGVLVGVMTLYKIIYFKSNFSIGLINSILGVISCLVCIFYAKSKNSTFYKNISIFSLVIISVCLVTLGIMPNSVMFTIYIVVYAIGMTLVSLTSDNFIVNVSNHFLVKQHKPEYHLMLETLLELSRIIGYFILLFVGIVGKLEFLGYILFFSIIPLTILVVYVNRCSDKYLGE